MMQILGDDCRGSDCQAYQVGIHNKDVRRALKDNASHSLYNDSWATTRYQRVLAKSEAEVRDIVSTRFPPEDGFVIDEIVPDPR